jgi:hypothetical protein
MKGLLVAIALAAFSVQASAESCTTTAKEKNLAGAAKNSFMKKCKADAKASCEATAKDKKLAGAAQTSFVKKCVKDAS